jgi:hypothetical protein
LLKSRESSFSAASTSRPESNSLPTHLIVSA